MPTSLVLWSRKGLQNPCGATVTPIYKQGRVSPGGRAALELVLDLSVATNSSSSPASRAGRRRGEDPAVAQDGHSAQFSGQRDQAAAPADVGRVLGEGDLDQVGLALAEGEQPDEVADGDRLLDQRRHDPRGGDGDVDAPGLVEQPLVAGWLTRATMRGTANSVLASSETTRLALSSPVAAIDDVAASPAAPPPARTSSQASASSHSALGHALGLDGRGVLVDEQDLVAVARCSSRGDGAADGAGPGDGDAHQCSPPWRAVLEPTVDGTCSGVLLARSTSVRAGRRPAAPSSRSAASPSPSRSSHGDAGAGAAS